MNSREKYLCIDDADSTALASIIQGFNDQPEIYVEMLTISRGESLDDLAHDIISKRNDFDGLLIDMKLNGGGANSLNYLAPTVAQELRTQSVTNASLGHFPIVLFSSDANTRRTYDADRASHDLFDYKFEKSDSPDWKKFSRKMVSLSKGYKRLSEIFAGTSNVELVFERADVNGLHNSMIETLNIRLGKYSTSPSEFNFTGTPYSVAQFIIKELFHHPGPLIKERILAARLGVDIEASGEAWDNLKGYLSCEHKIKYEGVFSDGWDRWWADLLEDWFKIKSGGEYLHFMDAASRVTKVTEFTGILGLIAASPIAEVGSASTMFWTICEYHKKPVDPMEAFVIFQASELKSWQEPKYLSFHAAAENLGRDRGLFVHPSEQDRLTTLKRAYSQNR